VSNLELVVEMVPTELLDVDGGRFHEAFASLLVQTGEVKRYREHCQSSLSRTIRTNDPLAAERVAKACLILPTAGIDLAKVSKLQDVALIRGKDHRFYSFFQVTKGWIEFRQGHYSDAIRWVEQGLDTGSSLHQPAQVAAFLILAMAYYQLGHTEYANSFYAAGKGVARAMPPPDRGGRDNYYCDWIIAHVLLTEAEALITSIRGPTTSVSDP
jgi:hypothetical protein